VRLDFGRKIRDGTPGIAGRKVRRKSSLVRGKIGPGSGDYLFSQGLYRGARKSVAWWWEGEIPGKVE